MRLRSGGKGDRATDTFTLKPVPSDNGDTDPAKEAETALLTSPEQTSIRITEKEILEDKELRGKIKEYYDRNPVERSRWYGYPYDFDRIIDLEVIEISGNRAELDLSYIVGVGGVSAKPGDRHGREGWVDIPCPGLATLERKLKRTRGIAPSRLIRPSICTDHAAK